MPKRTDRDGHEYLGLRHKNGRVTVISPGRQIKKRSGLSGRQWRLYRKGERRLTKLLAAARAKEQQLTELIAAKTRTP